MFFRNGERFALGVVFRSGSPAAKKLWPAIVRHRSDLLKSRADYMKALREHLSNERVRVLDEQRKRLADMIRSGPHKLG